MSETTSLPFVSAMEAEVEVEGPDRRRLLLLIAVGVLLAALVAYFVAVRLLGGGHPAAGSVKAPVHRGAAAAAVAKPKVVPKTFTDVVGRDPFAPLVTPPAAKTASTSTVTTANPAAPAASPAPAAVAPPTTAGLTTFKVLSVSGNSSTVLVDTKKYTVNTGQVFAGTYRLLKTSDGSCGSFSHGEMRFNLCEGQTFIF